MPFAFIFIIIILLPTGIYSDYLFEDCEKCQELRNNPGHNARFLLAFAVSYTIVLSILRAYIINPLLKSEVEDRIDSEGG